LFDRRKLLLVLFGWLFVLFGRLLLRGTEEIKRLREWARGAG